MNSVCSLTLFFGWCTVYYIEALLSPDCADGLCCTLTCPCLSGTQAEQPITAPPVVMRRNFNWKDVDRYELEANKVDADGNHVLLPTPRGILQSSHLKCGLCVSNHSKPIVYDFWNHVKRIFTYLNR